MSESVVFVGVLARVADRERAAVKQHIDALPSVETFEVEAEGKMGMVIEAVNIDTAHAILREQIDTVDGVLGTWPVSLEMDGGAQAACTAAASPRRDRGLRDRAPRTLDAFQDSDA